MLESSVMRRTTCGPPLPLSMSPSSDRSACRIVDHCPVLVFGDFLAGAPGAEGRGVSRCRWLPCCSWHRDHPDIAASRDTSSVLPGRQRDSLLRRDMIDVGHHVERWGDHDPAGRITR